ncbi:carboxymuconolactone decarboxylase family protein [Sphingobacterium sp. lm-10]|uniref:carboxymuconolactone decarboxylase family protein n=1 Tax=Sphingobacterium sp. lm-10 TaxID=2944904 RepID=UPI0020223910|nr:carboxymuconolactone decarboxylase family protein [Sphingobacterium sp. lm-10]MCL7987617.1 carboxymuconolactone decarboxylase family protein [Sphingobacterium sp. lm-10]
MYSIKKITLSLTLLVGFYSLLQAQSLPKEPSTLSQKEQRMIAIASYAAQGELNKLASAIEKGLDDGWSISQIQEAIVHLYAYAGFPRSIRALQTFMSVLEERKAKGIYDVQGADATPINDQNSKYNRGKAILQELTGVAESDTKSGYAAFAPIIEVFLKEHLFADIFERDILNYAERELVTVSVLSSIGGVEPMLTSHLKICLNIGFTPDQLMEFSDIIKATAGKKKAAVTRAVLHDLLKK